MYTKHFGFKMLPFENVPDPVFFFDEGDHARIRNHIAESLKAGRGLTVVTGPMGSGKTTLSRMIVADFSHEAAKGIKLIWMAEPPGNSTGLFLFIAQELGLKPSSSERVFVIRDIQDALLTMNARGMKCLMIIDESHLMTDEVLNGIRLLNNLEAGASKLIQILLLGQMEIMETINKPEMESCKQRIATLEMMGEMKGDRIRQYISHRIQVAGGRPSLFSDTGWEALVLAFGSGSTPRIINSLCDQSLSVAFERGKTIADVADVFDAANGMGLGKEVFHYQKALRQMEKEKHIPPVRENESIKEPEKPDQGSSRAKGPDGPDMEHEDKESEAPSSAQERSEAVSGLSGKEQKGLKIPVLLLLLSIAALLSSIFFYCRRSGSSDPIACLQEFIRF